LDAGDLTDARRTQRQRRARAASEVTVSDLEMVMEMSPSSATGAIGTSPTANRRAARGDQRPAARGLPERTREQAREELAGPGNRAVAAAVARCLIIGCGCRGRSLARSPQLRGYWSGDDDADRLAEIGRGAEPYTSRPDRDIAPAFDHVSVARAAGSAGGRRTVCEAAWRGSGYCSRG
jgi:hypothetical protein